MDKILDNLYLGDWTDALINCHVMRTLCVIETRPEDRYDGMRFYVPILEHDEGTLAVIPPRALVSKLEECCRIIDHVVESFYPAPLLVHCWAGIERSPLTLAYWLIKSGKQQNFDTAYKFLQSKRPIVEDRRNWIPFDHGYSHNDDTDAK